MASHRLHMWLYAAIALLLLATHISASNIPQDGTTSALEIGLLSLKGRSLPDGQCSKDCGRTPEHCDAKVCVSNCDAKAECGLGADPPGKECPLNVCCGPWGYCGTTEGFCGDGCQSNCEQPSSTKLSDGDVTKLVIGYVEAWNIDNNEGCSSRRSDWLPVDTITHLNVAFYYISPHFYDIVRMGGVSDEAHNNLMNMKQKAPGLKIWLSIGGWTFSDNDTDTQPLWGEIAGSSANRAKFIKNLSTFMSDHGLDGVDLDWEYPGAPDRGGKEEDVKNFVTLVEEMRNAFDIRESTTGKHWGISFTAPTSYWYMRWFDLEKLMEPIDWLNLMSYDIHGSWDSPENSVGNVVLAHTNLTEIKEALNLLWRNNVPANKVNLGLGFYGRTYVLEDPNCRGPGCKFKSAGHAGPCTKTPGVLSYDEISAIRKNLNIKPTYDKEAGAKYMTYNQTDWLSFDDEDTFKDKVKFANEQGLRGLFIWAIDQDDDKHNALYSVIEGGKFKDANGIGADSGWQPSKSSCEWTACGSSATCTKPGTVATTKVVCSNWHPNGEHLEKALCCPIDAAPNPEKCRWAVEGAGGMLKGGLDVFKYLGWCGQADCEYDEVLIATSADYMLEGQPASCVLGGTSDAAKYCCKTGKSGKDLCGASDLCWAVSDLESWMKRGIPTGTKVCPKGRKLMTYARNACDKGYAVPYCCNEAVQTTERCFWAGEANCQNAKSCPAYHVEVAEGRGGRSRSGGVTREACKAATGECEVNICNIKAGCTDYYCHDKFAETDEKICCPAEDLNIRTDYLPVPLEYLFDTYNPDTMDDYNVNYDIKIDGVKSTKDVNKDANNNGFGWHIISGPPDSVTTISARDGSHWALYDCDDRPHEERRTVKAVCTDESDSSNCDDIFLGQVESTIVKMPDGCGPGKYAVAVSMTPSTDHEIPGVLGKHLEKRGISTPRVYDFTYDYDYSPIVKRGDKRVKIRIDYSTDPGYWAEIVAAQPGNKRRINSRSDFEVVKREMQEEVDGNHEGSWPDYLDHKFSLDRRSTPEHELHELHARWFSYDLARWMDRFSKVDESFEVASYSVNDRVRWNIFSWTQICELMGIPTEMYMRVWADLDINVETTAELNLIGDFEDLSSWRESHMLFRSKGEIKTTLNLWAFARMAFNSDEVELFGLDKFGATFSIPGLVTIGPNLRVKAQLDGEATLHTEAAVSLKIAEWEYTQQYPNTLGVNQNPPEKHSGATSFFDKAAPNDSGFPQPTFHADIDAQGHLTVTMKPVVSFGLTWAIDVPDVSAELGIEAWATIHADAQANVNNENNNNGQVDASAQVCWGARCGYRLYAAINAPTIFKFHLAQYWPLHSAEQTIIPQTCLAWELWDGVQKCEGCPDINDKLDLGIRVGGGGMRKRGLGLGEEGGVYDAGFEAGAGAGGDYIGDMEPAVRGKRKVPVRLKDAPVARVARPNIGVMDSF
ncbi:family 18 glycosyl hydrolase [Sordaria sp. MPI-SDFR-AT-0083]|nr:family 18 glycosyl hydrolase [Sordaria sp. MPI-SDFR-AT-0083]